jgi:hypothetical protein
MNDTAKKTHIYIAEIGGLVTGKTAAFVRASSRAQAQAAAFSRFITVRRAEAEDIIAAGISAENVIDARAAHPDQQALPMAAEQTAAEALEGGDGE